MGGFIQIIEFTTSRIDEVKAVAEQFRADRVAGGDPLPVVRGTITVDLDRPGTYFNIVEFPSREVATENSSHPATTQFAQRMAGLCDGTPRFYNLGVVDSWSQITLEQQQPERQGGVPV